MNIEYLIYIFIHQIFYSTLYNTCRRQRKYTNIKNTLTAVVPTISAVVIKVVDGS